MESLERLQQEAQSKDLKEMKYGNPGIRTNVWSKMCSMYGEAIGTFIGLNMDLAVQYFNQGFVTPLQNYENSLKNLQPTNSELETRDSYQYKQVKVE